MRDKIVKVINTEKFEITSIEHFKKLYSELRPFLKRNDLGIIAARMGEGPKLISNDVYGVMSGRVKFKPNLKRLELIYLYALDIASERRDSHEVKKEAVLGKLKQAVS